MIGEILFPVFLVWMAHIEEVATGAAPDADGTGSEL